MFSMFRRWMIACGTAATMTLPMAATAWMQGGTSPRASDGQSLPDQSPATQASFIAVWGDQAASHWVVEHEAELARVRAQSPLAPLASSATSTRPPATETPRPADATVTGTAPPTSSPVGTSPATLTPTMTLATSIVTPTRPAQASPAATVEELLAQTPTLTTSTPTPSGFGGISAPSELFTPRPTPTLPPSPTARGGSFMPSYTTYPGASGAQTPTGYGSQAYGSPSYGSPSSSSPSYGSSGNSSSSYGSPSYVNPGGIVIPSVVIPTIQPFSTPAGLTR